MNLLTAENLTKSFGLRKVLAGVNFSMQEADDIRAGMERLGRAIKG